MILPVNSEPRTKIYSLNLEGRLISGSSILKMLKLNTVRYWS